MYRKVITYTDFNGNERQETIRFNLTEAELTNMFNAEAGGLEKKLAEIIEKKDIPRIMENFELILSKSYGEMDADGRRFVKENGKRFEAFKETQAYSDFYMSLLSNDEEAAAFINGIMPESVRRKYAEANGNITALPSAE